MLKRLVAKCFSQNIKTDYYDTFTPVAVYTALRNFIVFKAYKNLNVNHLALKIIHSSFTKI